MAQSWFGNLPYVVLIPILGLLSVALALNVLWAVPVAFILSMCCFCTRRVGVIQGAHVLVTGGSSGIGLAVAKQCASAGAARVTIVGRNKERLEAAHREILGVAAGGRPEGPCDPLLANGRGPCAVEAIPLDLRECSQEQTDGLLNDPRYPVDVLICSAGDSGQPGSLANIPEESWQSMYQLNVIGCIKAVKAVIPSMKTRNKGSICLIGSMAGQIGIYGLSCYSASKFALRGFAEVLRMELAATDIVVNLTVPPDTDTPMLERENETKPSITKEISQNAGLWSAEDVARGILRGLSRGDFITGFGLDGFMLNITTAGMSPVTSPLQLVFEVLLLPILRLVGLFYVRSFDQVVRRHRPR